MATIGLNAPEYVSLSYQSSTNAFRTLSVHKCAIVACEAAAAGLRTSQCLHTRACCMQGTRENTVHAPLLLSPTAQR